MHAMQRHRESVMTLSSDRRTTQDASGFSIFSAGDGGAAHAMAHRMLDDGEFELGHALLGSWLEGRSGSGSEWLHLQFHMAVFELELGMWDAAFERYVEHLVPAAAHTSLALTDAPAIAWRLALSADSRGPIPWDAVRSAAERRLVHRDDPYVELHHVLAFAGAADLAGLDRWIRSRGLRARNRHDGLVLRFGRTMRAFVSGDPSAAAAGLAESAPRISEIGGSRAQNELFTRIAELAWSRARPSVSEVTAAA
jgi:hypothetical protein